MAKLTKRTLREHDGEYTIRVVDMPDGSKGLVLVDSEEHANVYVNAHLSHDEQKKAADHEMTHIINDDIHSDDDIDTIEARADGKAESLKQIPNLMRARDLMPKPEETVAPVAAPSTAPPSPPAAQLTSHQARVLLRAISDLDAWYYSDMP